MPRQKPTTELATLKKHQAALEAKLRAAQTKVKAEAKEKERLKHELVGAVALKEVVDNPSSPFALTLLLLMNAGITSAAVRVELGLAPLPKRAKVAALAPPTTTATSGGEIPTPALTAPAPEPKRQPAPVLIAGFQPPAPPPPAPSANPIGATLRGFAERAGFGLGGISKTPK